MKRWMRVLWLAVALTALAQAQEEPTAGDPEASDDPCAPLEIAGEAGEGDQPPADSETQPAPGEDPDALGRIGADGLPCPPLEVAGEANKPTEQATVDEDAESAAEVGDFDPTEEISEDYPVPLPSDI